MVDRTQVSGLAKNWTLRSEEVAAATTTSNHKRCPSSIVCNSPCTGFIESAVNQIVSKRFVKKQQMAWDDQNAHDLLQIRTAVLNDELRDKFEQWYPSMDANDVTTVQAA